MQSIYIGKRSGSGPNLFSAVILVRLGMRVWERLVQLSERFVQRICAVGRGSSGCGCGPDFGLDEEEVLGLRQLD